jgi:hypothetical protein
MSFPQIDADGNIRLAKRRCAATLSVAAADVFWAKNGQQTLCATARTAIRYFETSASNRQ